MASVLDNCLLLEAYHLPTYDDLIKLYYDPVHGGFYVSVRSCVVSFAKRDEATIFLKLYLQSVVDSI